VDDAPNPVVRTDMLLFLMIPLGLIACTIAVGPILASTVVQEAERPSAPVRLPWGIGGTGDVPTAPAVDGDAPARVA
jgi:hypothetical protein